METYVAAMAKAFSKTFPDIDNTTAAGLAEAVAGFEVDLAKTLVQHDKTVTPYNKLVSNYCSMQPGTAPD